MMFATMGVLGGIALGVVLILVLGRRIDPDRPSALSWVALALGVVATVMVVAGMLQIDLGFQIPAAFAIPIGFASAIAAVGALVKSDRHWPAWVALVVGAAPTLFWLVFFVGELVYPH